MGNAAIPSCAAEVKAWSANGERLAAGCDDGKVHILRSGDREWGKGIGEKPQTWNIRTLPTCGSNIENIEKVSSAAWVGYQVTRCCKRSTLRLYV